jgi:Bacteriophage Lambda NinG protein
VKLCAACCKAFEPARLGQAVCSMRCAIKDVRDTKAAAAAGLKARKLKAKPRSKWLQEAQNAFNAFIRARDAGLGCISCGSRTGKMNAGHYLSVGARPELRFEPLNVHLQDERCNTYLHGNLIAYRVELINRIGRAAVDKLEGHHPPKKYTIDDLRTIKDTYRAKRKALQKGLP